MLRQRAATAAYLAGLQQQQSGAQNTLIVNARMHEKAPVLGCHESIDNVLREIFIGNENTPAFANLRDQMAIATENAQRNL